MRLQWKKRKRKKLQHIANGTCSAKTTRSSILIQNFVILPLFHIQCLIQLNNTPIRSHAHDLHRQFSKHFANIRKFSSLIPCGCFSLPSSFFSLHSTWFRFVWRARVSMCTHCVIAKEFQVFINCKVLFCVINIRMLPENWI